MEAYIGTNDGYRDARRRRLGANGLASRQEGGARCELAEGILGVGSISNLDCPKQRLGTPDKRGPRVQGVSVGHRVRNQVCQIWSQKKRKKKRKEKREWFQSYFIG